MSSARAGLMSRNVFFHPNHIQQHLRDKRPQGFSQGFSEALERCCIKDVRLYGPDDARTRQRREARREARRKIFDLTTLFDARTSSRSEAEVQQSLVTHPHKSRTG